MGKRRQGARQDVLLLMEIGDIVGFSLPTEPGYIVSADTLEAWGQDLNQQARDSRSNKSFQVISERQKRPLKIFKKKPSISEDNIDNIAKTKQDEELEFLNRRREKNRMFIWLAVITALFAVIISIVVLVQLKKSADVPVASMQFMAVAVVVGIKQN